MKRFLISIAPILLLLPIAILAQIDWTKQIKNIPSFVGNALPDPGANGFVKRTAANVSTVAGGADVWPGLIPISGVTSGTNTGTNTFTGPGSFKNLQNVRYVSPTNIEGWAGGNAGAWANAAAADLGGPGTVYFRSGTYTIPTANPIILVSNVQFSCVVFHACTLNSSGFVAGDFFFLANSAVSDCYVGNFIMVGGGTSVDNRGITNDTTVGHNFTRCLIENNKISSVFDGIDLYEGSSDNTLRNNFIQTFGQQGFTIQGNTNFIYDNRIDSNLGTTNLLHGMYIQEGAGNYIGFNHITNVPGFCIQSFSVNTSGVITSTRIIGNYCKQGGQAASGTRGGIAFAETPPSTGNRQGVLADNTIESTNGNPIYVSASTDASVHHNTIITYQGDCITVQGSASFTTTRVSVDHNVCRTGTVSGNGIRANANGGTLQNIIIDHNVIDTVTGVGIWLQGCTDCSVTDNRLKDYNTAGAFGNAGIRIESTSLRNRVSGNIVTTANVTGTPPVLYIVDAASTDNQVFDNYLVTSLNAAVFADSGTRNRFFGNHTQVTSGVIETVTPFATVPAIETTAPASIAGQDVCYGDSTAHALKCSYNNGTFFQIPQVITATSAAFATATTAGTCVQNTTVVTNAATTMVVSISPVSTPGVGAVWSGFVSSAGNVTINECAVATSAGGSIAFNIRVTP